MQSRKTNEKLLYIFLTTKVGDSFCPVLCCGRCAKEICLVRKCPPFSSAPGENSIGKEDECGGIVATISKGENGNIRKKNSFFQ
jgi:hypothetical protein